MTDSSVDSNMSSPPETPSATVPTTVPPANGGWGTVKIADAANVRDDISALGDTAFVKRDERGVLAAKDLEKLVKSMLTPFPDKDRFDKIDIPNLSSISTIQNTASVAELLSKVSSHFTAYDLNLVFLSFPVLDLTDKDAPTWDGTTTMNLYTSYDDISVEDTALTVAWMRKYIISDNEMVRELTWTHEFLLACCSDEDGESSFARKIRGETTMRKSEDMFQFGGPLTLVIILKHISSSSENAIKTLQRAIPNLKITDVPGEDIPNVCNSLGYVLRRLDTSAMPNLTTDLLTVFQTSSHPEFNDVFKTWSNYILLKMANDPTWTEVLDRARAVYDGFSDTWITDTANDGSSAFNADDNGLVCHNCGKKGFTKFNCPVCKAKGGGDDSWKKSPWLAFPNAANGDVCTLVGEHKTWTKKIQTGSGVKDVKWCGKCFSKKYSRKGTWRDGPTAHFTHEHDGNANGRGGTSPSANLASSEPVDGDASSATEPAAGIRSDRSFSQALQSAAEGGN